MFMDQWDYSKVPKLELKWFIEKDHWIDLIVEGADIRYIGTSDISEQIGRFSSSG